MTADNRYIETLYADELISADVYLFCLDNNLYTVSDVEVFVENNHISNNDLLQALMSLGKEEQLQEILPNDDVTNEDDDKHLNNVSVVELYTRFKQECSIRTQNVLDRVELEFDFPSNFFFDFILANTNPLKEFKALRNSGVKTVGEIIDLGEKINDAIISCNIEEVLDDSNIGNEENNIISYTDEQKELLDAQLCKLLKNISVRSKNALETLRSKHIDIIEFYSEISSPTFEVIKLKNIGKGCVKEFDFVTENLAFLIKQIQEAGIPDCSNKLLLESRFGLTENQAEIVINTAQSKYEFPVFAIINTLIDSDERFRIIAKNLINIYNDSEFSDRDNVASTLGISAERVRQLRNNYVDKIISWVKNWAGQMEWLSDQYAFCNNLEYDNTFVDVINSNEGTCFNANFITTILYILKESETDIIGDYKQALISKNCTEDGLFIVPRKLSSIFDFNLLMSELAERKRGKVFETYSINIREYILPFFKTNIVFEHIPDIIEVCRKVLYKNLDLIINNYEFTIEQNSTKNLPDILEDILRTNGRIMSLDELFCETERISPSLTKDKTSLRGSILRNPNIVAVSRTSNYTLKEWEETEMRGGTIRDIVFEFLCGVDEPQSIELITDHVLNFRPETNDKSVYANICSDTTKRFSLFNKKGDRKIGLSHRDYIVDYELVEFNEAKRRRTFEDSIEEVEDFILDNGRYPFSSGVPEEEERLSRFLGVQNSRIKKGQLSDNEKERLFDLDNKYGHLKISKIEFEWNIKYDILDNFVSSHHRLPQRATEIDLYSWLYDQGRLIQEGRLTESQTQKLTRLKSMLKKCIRT